MSTSGQSRGKAEQETSLKECAYCSSLSPRYLPPEALVKVSVSCSAVSNSAIPWTLAHEAPLFIKFSRQEYGVGNHSLLQGDLPNPGIECGSPPLQADSSLCEPPGKPWSPRVATENGGGGGGAAQRAPRPRGVVKATGKCKSPSTTVTPTCVAFRVCKKGRWRAQKTCPGQQMWLGLAHTVLPGCLL